MRVLFLFLSNLSNLFSLEAENNRAVCRREKTSSEKLPVPQRKKKRSKKRKKGGALWEMTHLWKSAKNADFTRGAWKKLRTNRSAFPTFSPAPTAAIFILFYTLQKPTGPTIG